ncbi:hypothetical protein Tco_0915838 [Tanacetum coccineum]
MPVPPAGQVLPPDILNTHSAWVKASKEIVGLMLMTMEPDIQKNLEQLGAYDMLKELKTFYIDNLERLGYAMTQNLVVSLILVSLRKEYDSFVKNYNMHCMGKTVTELHAMLKLHEQTLTPKYGNQGKGKAKMGYAPVPAPPFAPKPKNPPTPKKDNPVKDVICHQCDEGLKGSRKLKPGALSLYVGDGHRAGVEPIGEYHLCLHSALCKCGWELNVLDGVHETRHSGTANLGLVYGTNCGNHVDVTGFVDSYHAKDPIKGRSMTGYAFLVHGCVAVKEAIWLRGLLEELGVELNTVVVNSDNQGAIHLSWNHVFHERTKHINVRYHFIREVLEAKSVKVLKVGTEHNVADALTKVVPGLKLQHYLELLNVCIG